MSLILVCDKCGEKVGDNKNGKYLEGYGGASILLSGLQGERWDLDLCKSCFTALRSEIIKIFGEAKSHNKGKGEKE